ncbi:MAG: hypothetical protein IPL94_00860 [Tetrasphaera sp.]|nr:hypothetical protein [Tetrasphaera sp.]
MFNPVQLLNRTVAILDNVDVVMARVDTTVDDVDRAVRESLAMLSQVARTLIDVDLRIAELYVLSEDVKFLIKSMTTLVDDLSVRKEQLEAIPRLEAKVDALIAAVEAGQARVGD